MPRVAAALLLVLLFGLAIGVVAAESEPVPAPEIPRFVAPTPPGEGSAKVYFYENGRVMLQEFFQDGELIESLWYAPDGQVLYRTRWRSGGDGLALFLRQDGNIRVLAETEGGLIHGVRLTFNEDGEVQTVEQYQSGQRIDTLYRLNDQDE